MFFPITKMKKVRRKSMEKWKSRCMLGACVTILAAGLIPFIGTGKAFAGESSCVVCHTDEDMLDETITVVKKKGSAKQSGAG
jgi:hypothetical protein